MSKFKKKTNTSQDIPTAALPDKFGGLEALIGVNHFPATVFASEDSTQKNYKYFFFILTHLSVF